jgi:aspartyl-tRNA(Asn)/glutamyl-tRNA(Gln) amidotransferase subunit C
VIIDIKHVAKLARLDLGPDEQAKYEKQLASILGYIDQLKALDVTGVEPLAHAGDFSNVFRADEPKPSLPVSEALQNAPEQAAGRFVVPKVVE